MQIEQAINSGKFHILKPRKALRKAFLKIKPNRTQIKGFKEHLIELLEGTNDTESEEFHKNLVNYFFKETWCQANHYYSKTRNRPACLRALGFDWGEIAIVKSS